VQLAAEAAASPGMPDRSAMLGFVLLARYHGVAVDPDQLRHRFASHRDVFGIDEALRAAKELGLKARRVVSRWERLWT
jgi:subfamily B ATP-binding cassette protein HlyB/CyaB